MSKEALALAHELLRQGLYDEAEMGWVVGVAQRLWPGQDEEGIRRTVLEAIHHILATGLGEMRDFRRGRDPEWIVWNLAPEAAIARIASEWDDLGRPPEFITGEIGWLFNTERGSEIGRSLPSPWTADDDPDIHIPRSMKDEVWARLAAAGGADDVHAILQELRTQFPQPGHSVEPG